MKARDYKGPSSDGDGDGAPLVVTPATAYSIMPQNSGKDYKARVVDVAQPIMAVAYRTTGNDGAYETGDKVGALTTSTDPNAQIIAFGSKDHGADAEFDLSPTLRAGGHHGSHANAGVPPAIAFALRGREGGAMPEVGGDQVGALRAASGGSSRDYVAFDTTQITSAANYSNPQPGDACHPLAAGAHPPAIAGSAVRRLTPAECEKLQGFEPGYTDIPWRGKDHAPDGPRYKALGNSMAVPCMAWIGRRIAAVEALSVARVAA